MTRRKGLAGQRPNRPLERRDQRHHSGVMINHKGTKTRRGGKAILSTLSSCLCVFVVIEVTSKMKWGRQ